MSSILDIPQIPSIDFVHIQNNLHMGFGGDVKDRLQAVNTLANDPSVPVRFPGGHRLIAKTLRLLKIVTDE
ncbi:MAG: hypothetical protein IJ551_00065 [Prevotella sp.]|nr:hypothetical protein [Prevotella sp.]